MRAEYLGAPGHKTNAAENDQLRRRLFLLPDQRERIARMIRDPLNIHGLVIMGR